MERHYTLLSSFPSGKDSNHTLLDEFQAIVSAKVTQ